MSLYGVDSVLTPWGDVTLGTLGRFFDTIKNNGGNCVNGLLYSDPDLVDAVDFFTGSADIVKIVNGVAFGTILRNASDLLHQKGMKYWIQLCFDYFDQMSNTLMSATARAKYATQVAQIVSQLNPDVVTLVSEPTSPTLQATGGVTASDQEVTLYEDWLVAIANAIRTVKSTVQIAVMGLPFWSNGISRIVADGLFNRLPSGSFVAGHYYTSFYDGVVPEWYYYGQTQYWYAPSDGSEITVTINGTPTQVSLARAKSLLFADYDKYYLPCLNGNVHFCWEAMGCNTMTPNVLQSIIDTMEYCNARGIDWITSGNDSWYGNPRQNTPNGYYAFPYKSPDTFSNIGQAMFNSISPTTNKQLSFVSSPVAVPLQAGSQSVQSGGSLTVQQGQLQLSVPNKVTV